MSYTFDPSLDNQLTIDEITAIGVPYSGVYNDNSIANRVSVLEIVSSDYNRDILFNSKRPLEVYSINGNIIGMVGFYFQNFTEAGNN